MKRDGVIFVCAKEISVSPIVLTLNCFLAIIYAIFDIKQCFIEKKSYICSR